MMMNAPDSNKTPEDIASILEIHAPRSRRRLTVWLILGLLLVAGTGFMLNRNGIFEGGPPVQYQTQPARQGELVVTVTATGNLQPTNQVDVGSELSGIIKTVDADFNDRVKAGQVLARLDTSKLTAQVLQSRAELASAKAGVLQARASIAEAKGEVARLEKVRLLTHNKAVSDQELDTARATLARAQADETAALAAVDRVQAVLDANEADLAKTAIKSPIDGMVLSRSVEPGQTVAASLQAPVLFTLAGDLTRMELQVDVDEADVGRVREGQEAEFTVDAYPDRRFAAAITQVRYGAEVNGSVVTYKTILQVDNPDLALRPGMTATAEIRVDRFENALLVPNAALRFSPPEPEPKSGQRNLFSALLHRGPHRETRTAGNPAANGRRQKVWVLQGQTPVPIPVEPGASDGRFTVISSGDLKPGTEVVVDTLSVRS